MQFRMPEWIKCNEIQLSKNRISYPFDIIFSQYLAKYYTNSWLFISLKVM